MSNLIKNREDWLMRSNEQRAADRALLQAKCILKSQKFDRQTIPLDKMKIDDIYDPSFACQIDYGNEEVNTFYKTPVLIGGDSDLLFGIKQIRYLKEKGVKYVNCVYIDSMVFKTIDPFYFKDQFNNKFQSWEYFAFGLYCVFIDNSKNVIFDEFKKNPFEYFDRSKFFYKFSDFYKETFEYI